MDTIPSSYHLPFYSVSELLALPSHMILIVSYHLIYCGRLPTVGDGRPIRYHIRLCEMEQFITELGDLYSSTIHTLSFRKTFPSVISTATVIFLLFSVTYLPKISMLKRWRFQEQNPPEVNYLSIRNSGRVVSSGFQLREARYPSPTSAGSIQYRLRPSRSALI